MTGYETRVSAYAVCLDDEGRMLLARVGPGWPPAVGRWTLPGGGLDFGEDPAVGALRELEEETGYRGRVVELLHVMAESVRGEDRPKRKVDLYWIQVLYRVAVTGGELRHELGGSTDMAGWVFDEEIADGRVQVTSIVTVARRLIGKTAAATEPVA